MLSLTRKTDYALVALARLAEAGPEQDKPVSVRQIAEEYSLPRPLLMNIFKDLQRAGLVRSTRGAHGGYELAESSEQIHLASVIQAIEGPMSLVICCDEQEADAPCSSCTLVDRCPVTVAMRQVNQRMVEFLRQITIRDLMTREVDVLLPNVGCIKKPSTTQS